MEDMMHHLRRFWPWIALIFVGAAFRLKIVFSLGTLWFDEAFSRRFALMSLGRMLDLLKYDVHPPLHAVLVHYWLKIFGDDVNWLRMLSWVTGVLGLVAFAFLARKLVGKRAAFLAVVMACLSPVLAYYGADGRMYALVFLLSVVTSWFFWKYAQGEDEASIPWFGCAMALALTHVTGALVLVAQALYLLRTPERRVKFRRLLPGFALVAFAFLIWLVPALLHRLGTAGGEWQFSGAQENSNATAALVYWVWLGTNRIVQQVVFAFLILTMFAGLLGRAERRPFFHVSPESEYLGLWFACCFLPFLVLPTVVPRYYMAAVPAFLLLLAKGFLNAAAERKFAFVLAIAAILVFSLPGLWVQTVTRPYNWDQAVDWVSERYQPGDRVVFVWFADKNAWDATAAKPFNRNLSGFDVRELYPFDDNLTEDERIVAHAGTLRMDISDLDRLVPLMTGANRVFFVPNYEWRLSAGGTASDAVNAWLVAHGWYLKENLAQNGRTQGVWLMVKR